MPSTGALSPDGRSYLGRLRRITIHVDPLEESDATDEIRDAANSLDDLRVVNRRSLAAWLDSRPYDGYTLGLAVGLTLEKQRNFLRAEFDTSSWGRAVATHGADAVVAWLDDAFDVVDSLGRQRGFTYTFGDVLVARGTTRQTAARAGTAGKLIEDAVEEIVHDDLGLPYKMRGRFVGRNGDTGPADIAIPDFQHTKITIACKGFDSTGSKLTAAVQEVQDMAAVRFADQYVFAVVDGIGWNMRQGDFRRMFKLYEDRRIDGLYTLSDLDQLRNDVEQAAVRVGLL